MEQRDILQGWDDSKGTGFILPEGDGAGSLCIYR